MPLPTILSDEEQQTFDYPPALTPEERAIYFCMSPECEQQIQRLRTPTNKVGFLIQNAYFKARQRFFVINRFRQEDIDYAAKVLGLKISDIHFSNYKKKIPLDHQRVILELLDYKTFDKPAYAWLEKEVLHRVQRMINPRELFFEALQLLQARRSEIPSYHRLSEMITRHYIDYENKLLSVIEQKLSEENRKQCDALLNTEKERSKGTLNRLTVINQSIKPKAIKASVVIFKQIESLFITLLPIIEALALTPQSCEYYAIWLKKAKLSQLKQFPDQNKLYLHLIAFIQHQFYLRQDAFVDILLKCVQSTKNTALKRLNESTPISRQEQQSAFKHLKKTRQNTRALIDAITEVIRSPLLSDMGKVEKVNELLIAHEKQNAPFDQDKIDKIEKSLDRLSNQDDYFAILEKLSAKLQLRVSEIITILAFNENNSDPKLLEAIDFFRLKQKKMNSKAPVDFASKFQEFKAIMMEAA